MVDTGIDVDSPEFAGRLSPLSRDIYSDQSGRGLDATDDHGTNVALVAAAARNGSGVLGMAWQSTVLALRADTPGTCAADRANPSEEEDCEFTESAIAKSVNYAVSSGAKVINLSLGGDGGVGTQVGSAIRNAINAGAVVVIASGNEGTDTPGEFASSLYNYAGPGVIIVGSVDENGQISSFSNKARGYENVFITARGEDVCCVYEDGSIYINAEGYAYVFSGTSFSAPQVSGAAALLAQAFPRLTGQQIVEILLESARDAGDAGADAIYGRGILDLAQAFSPLGTTSLAGSTTAVPLTGTVGTGSEAMGDALSGASLPTVVLDKYARAFDVDFGPAMRGAQQRQRLGAALGGQTRHVAFGNQNASLAFTIDGRGRAAAVPQIDRLRLNRDDAEAARVLAARVALRVSPETKVGFAFAESADGLVAQLQGQDRPAFLIAGNASGDDGMARSRDAAFAVRHQLGSWGLSLSAESGRTFDSDDQTNLHDPLRDWERDPDRDAVRSFAFGLDRDLGGVRTALGLTWMEENGTVLGAQFQDSLGIGGARTLFADAQANWRFAGNWRLGGALRQGWTVAASGGSVADGSHVTSRAWSADIERQGLFSSQDAIGLRLSQPLRVESGGLNLSLPVAWDYRTLTPTYGVRSLSLAPQGREITGELGWRGPLLAGFGSASLFYRHEPGHYQQAPDDTGVALRWFGRF